MDDRLPRKLAAILYADVAGYSQLTGDDEDATQRKLREYPDVITQSSDRSQALKALPCFLRSVPFGADSGSRRTVTQERVDCQAGCAPASMVSKSAGISSGWRSIQAG